MHPAAGRDPSLSHSQEGSTTRDVRQGRSLAVWDGQTREFDASETCCAGTGCHLDRGVATILRLRRPRRPPTTAVRRSRVTPTARPRVSCPPDPTSPFCLRSTRNYPNVIAQKVAARLTDVTCGAAETKDFFTAQHPDVRPAARRPEAEHPAGHHDHRRQRQRRLHQHHPVLWNRRHPDSRPGQPVQGQVRRLVREHDPEQDLSRPREGTQGGAHAFTARRRSPSSATRGSHRRQRAASTRCRSPPATSPTSTTSSGR